MLINIDSSLPEQIFSKPPKSIIFYDYDEIIFGSFWSILWSFYKNISSSNAVYLLSREMILRNSNPILISLDASEMFSNKLDEIGVLDDTYNCQDFFIWDSKGTWAVGASRDYEVAVLGLFADNAELKNCLQKKSLKYISALTDIIATLVADIDKIDRCFRSNYGKLIDD